MPVNDPEASALPPDVTNYPGSLGNPSNASQLIGPPPRSGQAQLDSSSNAGVVSQAQAGAPTATQEGIPAEVMALLKKMNFPGASIDQAPPDWAVQFAEDIGDAEIKGDVFGDPIGGFKFPGPIDVNDFTQIETWAHNFAKNSNWQYMPTAKMIWAAYNSHFTNQQEVNDFFFGHLPKANKAQVPWLQFGVDKQTYFNVKDSVGAISEKLMGNRANVDPNVLREAAAGNWSQDHIESVLRAQMAKQGMTWLDPKYGYDFKSWQEYKRQHQQDVIQRYGYAAAGNDQSYMKTITDPLQVSGTQTHEYQVRQGGQGGSPLLQYGQNAVR